MTAWIAGKHKTRLKITQYGLVSKETEKSGLCVYIGNILLRCFQLKDKVCVQTLFLFQLCHS